MNGRFNEHLNTETMENHHPKGKDPRVVPHDPRNEPIPAEQDPAEQDSDRPNEKEEQEARKEEGVGMKARDTDIPEELQPEQVIVNPTDGELPTGIQTGQTTRGSYSTDPATGAGRYADHRAGKFGTEDVAQPGNDQTVEPDPIDPQL